MLAIGPIRVQPRIFLKSQQASEMCRITDHTIIVPVLVNSNTPHKWEERALRCPISWFLVVWVFVTSTKGIAKVFAYILLKICGKIMSHSKGCIRFLKCYYFYCLYCSYHIGSRRFTKQKSLQKKAATFSSVRNS